MKREWIHVNCLGLLNLIFWCHRRHLSCRPKISLRTRQSPRLWLERPILPARCSNAFLMLMGTL